VDQRQVRCAKNGKGVTQGCCFSLNLCNLYSEILTMETLEGCGDFKTGGKIIPILKFVDNLVLLAKKEMVLHGTINRLMATGRCYGMEMNVEKPKVMKISKKPYPIKITTDKKNKWRMWNISTI
jgi:hypothetical protein